MSAYNIGENVSKYFANPAKQINMGWTVTKLYYISAFYIGIILVLTSMLVMTLNADYKNGTKSKMPFVIVAWVGVAMILFGIWTTLGSFYTLASRINLDVRRNPKCSLFSAETAIEAARLLKHNAALEENTFAFMQKAKNDALADVQESIQNYNLPNLGKPDASTLDLSPIY